MAVVQRAVGSPVAVAPRLVPVTVCPQFSGTAFAHKSLAGGIRKGVADVALPRGAVTTMGPEVVPVGTVTVIRVAETTVNTVAAVPLNVTCVVPVK